MMSGALIGVGAVMLIGLSAHTAVWYLIVAYLIYGAGAGLVSAPITNTALSGMPETRPVSRSDCLHFSPDRRGRRVAVTGAIVASSSSASCTPATRRGRWSPAVGHRRAAGHVLDRTLALATAERNGGAWPRHEPRHRRPR